MYSTVIGADKTGVYTNGVNHRYWTFQDTKNTYIVIHKTIGYKAIIHLLGNNLENVILLTYCWPLYLKPNAIGFIVWNSI